jgi:hypothetical protein
MAKSSSFIAVLFQKEVMTNACLTPYVRVAPYRVSALVGGTGTFLAISTNLNPEESPKKVPNLPVLQGCAHNSPLHAL